MYKPYYCPYPKLKCKDCNYRKEKRCKFVKENNLEFKDNIQKRLL